MDIVTAQLAPAWANAATTPDATLSSTGAGIAGVTVPAAADPQASARFADLMTQPVAAAGAPVPLHDGVLPAAGGTLGDMILSGLKSTSADFQDKWASVQRVLEGGNLTSVSEMIKLQMGVTQMSVQYEVLGKAVSRSTQNIDQLVKMQ